ncbi:MAG: protein translocase subunit SecD [Myxococcales bacterium]|nr:protein translocase subunit SecD [Myxococcales bacterium]
MKDYRILIILALTAVCIVFLIPTVTGFEAKWYPAQPINLGLDLQGGMHVVLHVDVEKAISDEYGHLAQSNIPEVFKDKNLAFEKAVVSSDGKKLTIQFAGENDRASAQQFLTAEWTRFKVTTEEAEGKPALALTLSDDEVKYLRDNALKQARETINNRVDEFNVREPEIYTQGKDQIVVRLPGVVDPGRAKKLIGRTAALEFKLVTGEATFAPTKEALLAKFNGKIPDGYDIYPNKDSRTGQDAFYVMRKTPDLSGAYLTDARVGYDQYQNPAVDFTFNEEGAAKFAAITGANIDKQLAILLDGVVYSAPVIRSRISNRGQITGEFSREDALDLAIVLRAGALPVPVRIDEERTVGATLGTDSIHKGVISFIVGGIAVILFMAVYYRKIGFSADLALILNVLMILAGLSMFGATLTMPGIAGIILTIGMAVDANVIIDERVREELRNGKTPTAAVRTGYDRALWTILDSNITTLVAAVVLYQFGTGPIKGFAVTLTIGLISSVFTSIVVTRVIAERLAKTSKDYLSI